MPGTSEEPAQDKDKTDGIEDKSEERTEKEAKQGYDTDKRCNDFEYTQDDRG